MENTFTGVAEDPRSAEDKGKDWQHDELFGAGTYVWPTKEKQDWKSYPIRNQDGSGECGAFSTCKALGVNNKNETGVFVNLNTAFIYNKRSNAGAGMWMQNMFDIACKYGAPSDPTLISDGINDEQAAHLTFTADQAVEALQYRSKNYAFVPVNIDTIASVVDAGFTPILLLRCAFKEWTAEPFVDPTVVEADWAVNHFVPVVDATMYNGKKCLIIEDSWGQQYGYKGVRIVQEDFINKRVFACGYLIDLKNDYVGMPKHTFTQALTYGMTGPEVKAWQEVLQYEKFLPTKTQAGTPLPLGSFLSMTAQATRNWQVAHEIMDYAKEKDMTKIRVGPKTILEANKLYS